MVFTDFLAIILIGLGLLVLSAVVHEMLMCFYGPYRRFSERRMHLNR